MYLSVIVPIAKHLISVLRTSIFKGGEQDRLIFSREQTRVVYILRFHLPLLLSPSDSSSVLAARLVASNSGTGARSVSWNEKY